MPGVAPAGGHVDGLLGLELAAIAGRIAYQHAGAGRGRLAARARASRAVCRRPDRAAASRPFGPHGNPSGPAGPSPARCQDPPVPRSRRRAPAARCPPGRGARSAAISPGRRAAAAGLVEGDLCDLGVIDRADRAAPVRLRAEQLRQLALGIIVFGSGLGHFDHERLGAWPGPFVCSPVHGGLSLARIVPPSGGRGRALAAGRAQPWPGCELVRGGPLLRMVPGRPLGCSHGRPANPSRPASPRPASGGVRSAAVCRSFPVPAG